MHKTWQRELRRARAAADRRIRFANEHRTSRTRQRDSCRQTVGPRADDNGVISTGHHFLVATILEAARASCDLKQLQAVFHAQTRRIFRFKFYGADALS